MAGFGNSSLFARQPSPGTAPRPSYSNPAVHWRYQDTSPRPGATVPSPGYGQPPASQPFVAGPQRPPSQYAVMPTAGQPPRPPVYASRPDAGQPPQPAYGYAQMPELSQPPEPGYVGARPLAGRDLSLRYASRPSAGQPPQPAFAYAQMPSAGQPPVPAYGYAAQPSAGVAPSPAMAGLRLPVGYAAGSYAPPVASAGTATGQLASVSERPMTPSPYDNINLPATSLGPNQSTGAVRQLVANRYDPRSWANATTTPGEQQAAIASRVSDLPGRLASSQMQDRYSPVAGMAARNSIDAAYAQQRAAQDARFQQGQDLRAENDAKVAAAGLDPQAYRNGWANESAQYANYAQRARESGGRAMTHAQWRDAGGPDGSEHQALASQPRVADVAPARTAQPNYQASAYLAQNYGVPMAMPKDPATAQNWLQTMAAAGNPMAGGMYHQQVDQQGLNTRNTADNQTRAAGYESQLAAAKAGADADMYGADRRYDAAQLGVDAEDTRYKREEAQRADARQREELSLVQNHLNDVMERARSVPGAGDQEVQAARMQALQDLRQNRGSLPSQFQAELDAASAKPVAGGAPSPNSITSAAKAADMSAGGVEQAKSLANSLSANGIPPTKEQAMAVAEGTPLADAISNPAKAAQMYRELLEQQKAASDQAIKDNTSPLGTAANFAQSLTPGMSGFAAGDRATKAAEGTKQFRGENEAAFKLFESLLSPEERRRIEGSVFKVF